MPHDLRHRRCRLAQKALAWEQGHTRGGNGSSRDDGRPVPRVEDRGVDAASVGSRCERARGITEKRQHGDRLAARGGAERGRVEDEDQCAADAGRQVLGRNRTVLPAACAADKGAAATWTREDYVGGLVADEKRADDARRADRRDDRHVVRELVHDPDLAGHALGDGHRLETHRHAREMQQSGPADLENLEPVIRCVQSVKARAVSRQRQAAHLPGLKRRECGGSKAGRRGCAE